MRRGIFEIAHEKQAPEPGAEAKHKNWIATVLMHLAMTDVVCLYKLSAATQFKAR